MNDRIPCPTCGVTVMLERDRPMSLWLIPAFLPNGEHIIIANGYPMRHSMCPGILPFRPWYIRLFWKLFG